MLRHSILIILIVFLTSCSHERKVEGRNVKINFQSNSITEGVNEKDFSIKLLTKSSKDTLEYKPEEHTLFLPYFSKEIIYFRIEYKNCISELSGKMLDIELPGMLDRANMNWTIKIKKLNQRDIQKYINN